MSDNKRRVIAELCESAINRVDAAIEKNEQGESADLSVPMLQQVRTELEKMRETMSPSLFRPTFGRFVLEWPDEHGLVGFLTEVNYQYGRLK